MTRSRTGGEPGREPAPGADLDRRERLIAQIVRDFMAAYDLEHRIGAELRAGTLAFSTVDRLVGETPRSILYRLKEDCHALSREPSAGSEAVSVEELFDLAVGALFHEAMKFRESYYLAMAYGPRARRRLAGASGGPLAQGFRRLFYAGNRRMMESQAEMEQLFRETREQLRVLLRDWACAGSIARGLVTDPELTERVFGLRLSELLEELYGSTAHAYALALQRLTESGHYPEAAALLERPDLAADAAHGIDPSLIRGLARYYEGDPCGALRLIARWYREGAPGAPALRGRACVILSLIAAEVEEDEPRRAAEALRLEASLRQAGG